MTNRLVLLSTLLVLVLAIPAWAQLKTPQIADMETGTQKIMYLKTGETLYNITWTVSRHDQNGRRFYTWDSTGDNDKQGAERIDWTEHSVVEITDDGLRTVSWKKESFGSVEQMTWNLEYDWDKRRMHYTWKDFLTGKEEDKFVEFEADAWPGDALNFLLRSFPFEKGEGHKITGQIVMTDGSIIGGHIIHRGEETLETAFGPIQAYKLELKPTGALGLVAPDMFMWFTKSEPHIWIRYDGRDEGPLKPRTKNVLLKYEPADWIK